MNIGLDRSSRIYVAGHRGMVGGAIWRRLSQSGFSNLIGRTRAELDLQEWSAVRRFYEETRPEYVFVAAAKVGGILANDTFPVDFLYENLQIQNHLIRGAHEFGVRKLLFLGSSCIYPREATQPIPESALLTGPLESTNEWYAIAKIAGIKLCQAYRKQYGARFISVMPCNLYGIGDNYHPTHSHVLPAFIRRFHEAKRDGVGSATCWGSGTPRREFLFSEDLAEACVFLMEHYDDSAPINVGAGVDRTIRELAETVRGVVGFEGEILWDRSKPDGTPAKRIDISRITSLGWAPRTGLVDGIARAYGDFLDRNRG